MLWYLVTVTGRTYSYEENVDVAAERHRVRAMSAQQRKGGDVITLFGLTKVSLNIIYYAIQQKQYTSHRLIIYLCSYYISIISVLFVTETMKLYYSVNVYSNTLHLRLNLRFSLIIYVFVWRQYCFVYRTGMHTF